ncbi:MAG: hypothetical protein ABSC94_19640 [Polyangiaceae bacterium]|jgi:hypothetical protein
MTRLSGSPGQPFGARAGFSSGARRKTLALGGLFFGSLSFGCVHVAPPASAPPTADAALGRMHATFACANAVQASAKFDHFGEGGRIRGDLLLFAARPARIRMDVVSPFGVTLATLTSDGSRFALADLRDKRVYVGVASACNIARLTTVPVPGHVLVDLLRGEAPVVRHEAQATSIVWNSNGYWVITLVGSNDAREQIQLAPRPEDWKLPWQEQRVRVLDVEVRQQGYELYHAELGDHAEAPTAIAREDPDHLGPTWPPSGPHCSAELPRKIHVEVPSPASDVRFRYEQQAWNPPLPDGTFDQVPTAGLSVEVVSCGEPGGPL